MRLTSLDKLLPGEWGKIKKVEARAAMRRRLFDIGICEGTAIKCVQTGPGGSISAYFVRGAVIALRRGDARNILLTVNGG